MTLREGNGGPANNIRFNCGMRSWQHSSRPCTSRGMHQLSRSSLPVQCKGAHSRKCHAQHVSKGGCCGEARWGCRQAHDGTGYGSRWVSPAVGVAGQGTEALLLGRLRMLMPTTALLETSLHALVPLCWASILRAASGQPAQAVSS